MSTIIIIAVCLLMLLAYIFELTSAKSKIPSVILLLLTGWLMKLGCDLSGVNIPDFSPLLPVCGTVGLLLIVLEGSLELEFDKSKLPLVKKSFYVAILPVFYLALTLTALFHFVGGYSIRACLLSSIPLCVISSAIAIPSAKNLDKTSREFVTYETSLSDIIGVVLFNFIAANEVLTATSFLHFGFEILIVLVLSFILTLGLSFLLSKIDSHVKFGPIIIMVILIYFISKHFHLPGLLFVMILGLFLGNLEELRSYRWIQRLKPEVLHTEALRMKEIVIEATFVVRAFFFLLFGFLLKSSEILNPQSITWAIVVTALIFGFRWAVLKVFRMPFSPVGYIAPRGLITILLFLGLTPQQAIPLMNKSLIVQVVLLTAVAMMVGVMRDKSKKEVKGHG